MSASGIGSWVRRAGEAFVNLFERGFARYYALEGFDLRRFLCPVRPGHLQQGMLLTQGILTGALAAAATAGALLGFGIQQGTPARPFNSLAALLLGDRAGGIWGFHPVVTVVGLLVHLTVTLGWGVLFARVARGMRGLRLAAAAVGMALVALAVDVFVVGRLAGGNVTDVLTPAQVIALHVVLGVALGVGMRLATSYLWTD